MRCPQSFLYIGSTPEVNPYRITGRARVLHLSTHCTSHAVFLQLSTDTPPLSLNPAEVAAYRWVDFEIFTHRFRDVFSPKATWISTDSAEGKSRRPGITMKLAAIALPRLPRVLVSVIEGDQPDRETEFMLWGITYRVRNMQRVRAMLQFVPAALKTNSDADWVFYQVPFPFCLFAIMFSWADRTYGPDELDLRAYQRYSMLGCVAGTGIATVVGLRWLGYL